MEGENFDGPTQNLPRALAQDGVVDIIRPETIFNMNSMVGKKIAGFLDHPQTWDIDCSADLRVTADLLQHSNLLNILPSECAFGGNLGIVQGRLTKADELQHFPNDCWENEFESARKVGYTAIELFRHQFYNVGNPLWNPDYDVEQLCHVAMMSGVGIRSVCDDFVQQCCWEELTAKQYSLLGDLLVKASQIGASLVVYPLFNKANIETDKQREAFVHYIKPLATLAYQLGIKIALEISQNAEMLRNLFCDIDSPNIGFCLDTGNLYAARLSAIEILQEKRLHPYLYHVHLKDRDSALNNVVPGAGCVDFTAIFEELFEIGYNGTLVTETNRGKNPIDTAIMNKKWFALASSKGYALWKGKKVQ